MGKYHYHNERPIDANIKQMQKWVDNKMVDIHTDKDMKQLVYATLTYDNRHILTIEKNKNDCAYIRCYILDKNAAELDVHEKLYQEGDISSHASFQSINSV